jgi:hypothetical protein
MLDVEALSEMMAGVIAEEVSKAVAPLNARIAELEAREPVQGPPGEKGEKGDAGERGADGIDGKDGRDGKDGVGVTDTVKDSGELCFTLGDGRLIRTGIRDGEKGADGKDGLGFDDMDACVLDDDRTIELSFRRGDEEKAFTFKWPTVIYRSVFKDGEQYQQGDMVTWGGSLWHCDKATTAKPGTDDWTLAAKKGRDGKDAKNG